MDLNGYITAALAGDKEALLTLKDEILRKKTGRFLGVRVVEDAYGKKGNFYAMWLWGIALSMREDGAKNYSEALKLFLRVINTIPSTERDSKLQFIRCKAIVSYSCICTEFIPSVTDARIVIEFLKEAAAQGDASAQFNLGYLYYSGEGVEQSDKEAFHYYKMAADLGSDRAQFEVGHMYYYGIGVKQNHKQAVHYYILAAKRRHVMAQSDLGQMYFDGEGVEKNYKKTCSYLTQSVANGYEVALETVQKILRALGKEEFTLPLPPLEVLETLRWFSIVLRDKQIMAQYSEKITQSQIDELLEIITRIAAEAKRKIVENEGTPQKFSSWGLLGSKVTSYFFKKIEVPLNREDIFKDANYYMQFIQNGFDCFDVLWKKPEMDYSTGKMLSVDKWWAWRALKDKELLDGSLLLYTKESDEAVMEKLFKLGRYFFDLIVEDETNEEYQERSNFVNTIWSFIPEHSQWKLAVESYEIDHYIMRQYPQQTIDGLYKETPWQTLFTETIEENGKLTIKEHVFSPREALLNFLKLNALGDKTAQEHLNQIQDESLELIKEKLKAIAKKYQYFIDTETVINNEVQHAYERLYRYTLSWPCNR